MSSPAATSGVRAEAAGPATLMLNPAVISAVIVQKLGSSSKHSPRATTPRLLLVRGRYGAGSPERFSVQLGTERVAVRVYDGQSVLGITEVVQQHLASVGEDVLVVTTTLDHELGWDVFGHAIEQDVHSVEVARVVAQRFGASEVDPRIHESWLVAALLDAEPAAGWTPVGGLLTRDGAISALVVQRLSLEAARTDSLDVLALVEWAATTQGPGRYMSLSEAERAGIRPWLCAKAGQGAEAVLGLVELGRAEDVSALGLLCAVSSAPAAGQSLALLLGPVVLKSAELAALWTVVNGQLSRWAAEIQSRPGAASSSERRRRLEGVVRRADQLAAENGLTPVLVDHPWLPSSWNDAFRELAAALSTSPVAEAAVGVAQHKVETHGLAQLFPPRRDAARDAVRLARWLREPAPPVASVDDALHRHVRDWAWVDRALASLWAPNAGTDHVVAAAYGRVYEQARQRRDEIDQQSAIQLATWAAHAAAPNTAGVLVVEEVLERIAVPLAAGARPPLVVLLDGMSSAVAVELTEQLSRDGWFEVSPAAARIAAASVLPSVTRLSRTSLLTGSLQRGDQRTERDGFPAFWKRHGRSARMFHKADLAGAAGHRFSQALHQALDGDDVVGVVLNTIDDALDHGREGLRSGWSVGDVTYLADLLDVARETVRPVLLVADHGHVLERHSQDDPTSRDAGDTSARWRTGGTVSDGEIEISGPRVLEGGGRVVLPWRESIRYSKRRAGYHGGASLAEVTVPVIVLLPSRDQLPTGWQVLSTESVTPSWWSARQAVSTAVTVPPVPVRRAVTRPPKQEPTAQDSLFAVEDVPATAAATSLGGLVVGSDQYALTRATVRKPPTPQQVAAVIDALVAADGTMSLTAVAGTAGRSGRNPEGLVSTLQRLLNIEGYQVLSQVDGGTTVRLDVALLVEQFGLST